MSDNNPVSQFLDTVQRSHQDLEHLVQRARSGVFSNSLQEHQTIEIRGQRIRDVLNKTPAVITAQRQQMIDLLKELQTMKEDVVKAITGLHAFLVMLSSNYEMGPETRKVIEEQIVMIASAIANQKATPIGEHES